MQRRLSAIAELLVLYTEKHDLIEFQDDALALTFSKLLCCICHVWVAISAILWPGCPSAVLSFIIVLLLI